LENQTNDVQKLAELLEKVAETAGRHVAEFSEELRKSLEKEGKNAVELNFSHHAAKFLSAMLLDRLEEMPKLVKFMAVCDELMYGETSYADLAEEYSRNPRHIEGKRSMAKEFVDQTTAMMSKLSDGIQTRMSAGVGENADVSDEIRKILATCTRDELVEMLEVFRKIKPKE
jgi:hypothetical protein